MHPVIAFAFLLLAAAAPAPSYPPPAADEQARIEWVSARGRLLFELDRAAWVGTDDMRERIPDAASSGMRGYIVEPDGSGFAVTFFGGPEAAPVAFYRGRIENRRVVGREVFPADARPPLTPLQRRFATVRQRARDLGRRPCGEAAFNTVVIPPDTPDGPIDLYLLTPQVRDTGWPAGGHYRFTIAAYGAVLSSRQFTNTCIEVGYPPGSRAEGLGITHLLDPIPTEIHVFTALTSGHPLFVATRTPERVWQVTGEGIRLIERARR